MTSPALELFNDEEPSTGEQQRHSATPQSRRIPGLFGAAEGQTSQLGREIPSSPPISTAMQRPAFIADASWPASIASIAYALTTPGTPEYEAPETDAHDIFELPTRLWVENCDALAETERQAAILAWLQSGTDVINMAARVTGTELAAQTPGLLSLCFPQLFPLSTLGCFVHESDLGYPHSHSLGRELCRWVMTGLQGIPAFYFFCRICWTRTGSAPVQGHAFNPQITDMRHERRSELLKILARMTAGKLE